MASLDKTVDEKLPPVLDASAEQPPLFDGTIRLYACYTCPLSQRVWIIRNYKGLQENIKLVPLNLLNRPAWFGKKVYSVNNKFSAAPAFDYLENALNKYDDGPFFLGQFSFVDIIYIPFVERTQIFLSETFKYDITAGRPKLATWIEEMNKIEAYKQTKTDPTELAKFYKNRFLNN